MRQHGNPVFAYQFHDRQKMGRFQPFAARRPFSENAVSFT